MRLDEAASGRELGALSAGLWVDAPPEGDDWMRS